MLPVRDVSNAPALSSGARLAKKRPTARERPQRAEFALRDRGSTDCPVRSSPSTGPHDGEVPRASRAPQAEVLAPLQQRGGRETERSGAPACGGGGRCNTMFGCMAQRAELRDEGRHSTGRLYFGDAMPSCGARTSATEDCNMETGSTAAA
eukprot:365028-Chlamydomonas_euryale.AAC.5